MHEKSAMSYELIRVARFIGVHMALYCMSWTFLPNFYRTVVRTALRVCCVRYSTVSSRSGTRGAYPARSDRIAPPPAVCSSRLFPFPLPAQFSGLVAKPKTLSDSGPRPPQPWPQPEPPLPSQTSSQTPSASHHQTPLRACTADVEAVLELSTRPAATGLTRLTLTKIACISEERAYRGTWHEAFCRSVSSFDHTRQSLGIPSHDPSATLPPVRGATRPCCKTGVLLTQYGRPRRRDHKGGRR
jgi:hypothetical protein